MTTLAINAANPSFAFLGAFVDVLETAVAMANAVRRENPDAGDVKKLRAIANRI